VQSSSNKQPSSICEGECQQTGDGGFPVIKHIFCQLFIEVIGYEATNQGKPKDEEVYEIVEDVKSLILGSKTITHLNLAEQKKEEIL